MKKIMIVGAGYVGLSIGVLLSKKHEVIIVDIDKSKVDKINAMNSPIEDTLIQSYLDNHRLNLTAVSEMNDVIEGANFIIVATPTNYDPENDYFDCSAVENVVEEIHKLKSNVNVIIKSTIPLGYTEYLTNKYENINVLFSPEFLREGKALYDNLNPSRIVVGSTEDNINIAESFGTLLQKSAEKEDVEIQLTGLREAEAIKLFANTYLAMRVAFFNELDTFSESYTLNTNQIIKGVSLDPRIGDYYNNPSFGYGGYCLPKDTKQLLATYRDIPQSMIESTVKSNAIRKEFIATQVLKKAQDQNIDHPTVGIHRLTMKSGSDNFRETAILDVAEILRDKGVDVIIYEPLLGEANEYEGFQIISTLLDFKRQADIILANRLDNELNDVDEKVYTRDVFKRD